MPHEAPQLKMETKSSGPGIAYRAASSLKSSTVAAGLAVGSSIIAVAPQMVGAIDVMMVRQPDGSIKSSPFYVRFGKYTGLRTADKKVQITVNGVDTDFHMHLGRTGEAYFVAADGDEGFQEDGMAGIMSPASGYSSSDEPTPFATSQQASSLQVAMEEVKRQRQVASEPNLAQPTKATSPRKGPARSQSKIAPATEAMDTTYSAPAALPTPAPLGLQSVPSHSLPSSPLAGHIMHARSQSTPASPTIQDYDDLLADLVAGASTGGAPNPAGVAGLRLDGKDGTDLEKARQEAEKAGLHLEGDDDTLKARVKQEAEGMGLPVSHGTHVDTSEQRAVDIPKPSRGFWSSLIGSGGSSAAANADANAQTSPPEPRRFSPDFRQSSCEQWADADDLKRPSSEPSSPAAPIVTARGSSSRPPAHPWSVGRPRLLPTPSAAQPMPVVIEASKAAAPVDTPHAVPSGAEQQNSAIPAVPADPHRADSQGGERVGNRMELEAIDQGVREHETAQFAMFKAQKEMEEWTQGGEKPDVKREFRNIAEVNDMNAAAAGDGRDPSLDPTTSYREGAARALHISTRSPAQCHSSPTPSRATSDGSGASTRVQPATSPFSAEAYQAADAKPLSRSPSPEGPDADLDPETDGMTMGASPPDAGGYLGDSEALGLQGSLGPRGGSMSSVASDSFSLGRFGSSSNQGPSMLGRSLKSWAALDSFELSLCASLLRPDLSPQEALDTFEAHKVGEQRYAEAANDIIASPELVCRIGRRLFPFREALPMVLGVLAFGGQWDTVLTGTAGLPMAVAELPPEVGEQQKQSAQQQRGKSLNDKERRSSWRVWLGSWRSSSRKDDALAIAGGSGELLPNNGKRDESRTSVQSAPPGTLSPGADLALERMLSQRLHKPARRRAFVPTPQQLASLPLHEGQNTIDFTFGKQRQRAYVYFLKWNSRLVISDIDGTITKSDILGHFLPRVGVDWSHIGVNRLFTNIRANGYDIMYLSSRAIAQASATRDYLHSLKQNGESLPSGPVIISPDGLFPSLYRELVLRRPHEFKIRCLEDIRALFPPDWNPFYAGFGNRDTDEISYFTVGVPPSKIFIINPRGELRKASSTVATSTWASLTGINSLVDEMFPALLLEPSADTQQREEYSDYNFWHVQPAMIIDDPEPAARDAGQASDHDFESADEDDDSYDEDEDMPHRNGLTLSPFSSFPL
ncbi:hypothetical protein WJX72_003248 [[Myrmecia] bisecta]|uniref:phosphatidate phosphatase n=1 Tax=[Myrmecia] bisecta TaxID=41462 RepID=A0AAW1PSQ1_9CHLO